jgi:hypothetical protein
LGEQKLNQQTAEDKQLIHRILGEIKMNLYKWSTNSTELTKILRRELEFFSQPSALAIDEMFEHTDKKELGILWYPKTVHVQS